jgi:hypothetical protein
MGGIRAGGEEKNFVKDLVEYGSEISRIYFKVNYLYINTKIDITLF